MVCEGFKQAGCMCYFAKGHNEQYGLYCGRLLLWAYLRPKTKGHNFKLKIPTSHSEGTQLACSQETRGGMKQYSIVGGWTLVSVHGNE